MSPKPDYRARRIFEAVCDMVPKSEQLGPEVLLSAYVNMGHAEKCTTATHQYIDGRRGTGKTHLLGYLAEAVNSEIATQLHCAIYIDVRDLALESGEPSGPKGHARDLFRELVLRIADGLRRVAAEHLWQNEVPTERTPWEQRVAMKSHAAIDTLFTAAIVGVDRPTSLGRSRFAETFRESTEAGASVDVGVTAQPMPVSATGKGLFSWLRKRESSTETEKESAKRISYLEIREAVEEFLDVNDLERLYLMIDEWSFVPNPVQPLLADLLKRAFMPSSKISLKIAALPFQTSFALSDGKDTIGFERNGDIYQAIDLDADLVYQRNPERSARVLAAVLHRHLDLALRKLVNDSFALPEDPIEFREQLFTEEAHVRLLKFSHGNPRDYLTMFKKAYLDWREGESLKINVDNVSRAARDFGAEKLESIKENAIGYALFQHILQDILHGKHQGVFMVREKVSGSTSLQYLVHSRVLHVYDRSYSSPTYPGERFAVLAIDYCVIVDHLNAPNYRHILKAPDVVVAEANAGGRQSEQEMPGWSDKLLELQDPDRRRIRSTVLSDEYFAPQDQLLCTRCGKQFDTGHPVYVRHRLCPACGEAIVLANSGPPN